MTTTRRGARRTLRTLITLRLAVCLCAVGGGVAVLTAAPRAGRAGQATTHPPAETFHWVLPAQHREVQVTDLHPGDCYVIQRVEGLVYFGEPLLDMLELQRQLGEPLSHRVESTEDHPECRLAGCVDVARVAGAITTRLRESGVVRATRSANHLPSPLDGMRGGAYSDVGSEDRPRYRRAPEQRMVHRHLKTAARDNCYEAEFPRTLTVHIRDTSQGTGRTGVYSGYLYLEHHHPAPPGRVAQHRPSSLASPTARGCSACRMQPDFYHRPSPEERHQ